MDDHQRLPLLLSPPGREIVLAAADHERTPGLRHTDLGAPESGLATTVSQICGAALPANAAARAEWKAGAKQGAFGTPQVQVNGEWDRRVESFTTLDEWEDYFADACAPNPAGKVAVRDARTDAAAAAAAAAAAGARRG
ncbi:hypothetical protein AMAG_15352 [Allomyces macrogynus ATCC 38327]|uniref:Uncharacterized protein n=1 Tax=Allomyces macrogynus (strain ATCC 38327) TaxID=578462 RepID=A0A0L0T772_ALLM3|nr:hypothetical protein AMAG_15352 [Allomyces macrogynus ATCC 38327]|eukprot:KNE70592.1 hypothetical protein AMAG_15352 [Allomyces macrogynus ATCC 38327]